MYYITDNDIIETLVNNAEKSPNYNSALEILKRRRSTLINNSYQSEVDGRFLSYGFDSVNGRWYDSKDTDRSNLIGVVACGKDSYYKCYANQTDKNGTFEFHTINQLKNILNDGRQKMIELIQKKGIKISQIESATTKEGIVSISW